MVPGGIEYFMLNVKGLNVDCEDNFFRVSRVRVGALRNVDGFYRLVFSILC